MYKRLNNLGFVIGVFFILVALILLIGGLLTDSLAHAINLYTGGVFLLFGVAMVAGSRGKKADDEV